MVVGVPISLHFEAHPPRVQRIVPLSLSSLRCRNKPPRRGKAESIAPARVPSRAGPAEPKTTCNIGAISREASWAMASKDLRQWRAAAVDTSSCTSMRDGGMHTEGACDPRGSA
eukprot:scaffold305752_cov30-Tisochrysis_lutea.AAC.3